MAADTEKLWMKVQSGYRLLSETNKIAFLEVATTSINSKLTRQKKDKKPDKFLALIDSYYKITGHTTFTIPEFQQFLQNTEFHYLGIAEIRHTIYYLKKMGRLKRVIRGIYFSKVSKIVLPTGKILVDSLSAVK